jgi:SAM-dependent methyltransferase
VCAISSDILDNLTIYRLEKMNLKYLLKINKLLLRIARYINYAALNIGLDVRKFFSIRRLPGVVKDYFFLKKQNKKNNLGWNIKFTMPSFYDFYDKSGVASGHYFHQDLLVAQKILKINPVKHVDVGSRVETFVAHVATFREIEVVDIRSLVSATPNIIFRQCDFTDLPKNLENYCDSVSCLHALEHFGLGRYGDLPDINGHLKGFDSLFKILKPGGILYLSFPIGYERIEFNAHRVFNVNSPLDWAKNKFELIDFSYIDDEGDLHTSVDLNKDLVEVLLKMDYGCGIYEFRKL